MLWKVTESTYAVIAAPTADEAERLYREYPLNPERQKAVKHMGTPEIATQDVTRPTHNPPSDSPPDFADSCCGKCPGDTCYVDQVLGN